MRRRFKFLVVFLLVIFGLTGCDLIPKEYIPEDIAFAKATLEVYSEEPNWDDYLIFSDDEGATYTITYDSTSVDFNTIGNYEVGVTITYEDESTQNFVIAVSIVDSTSPVITLVGNEALTIEVHSDFNEEGITFTDNYDTEYEVTITGNVDTSVVGEYLLTYTVTDSNSNISNEITRIVNVVDTQAPVISFKNGDTEQGEIYETYIEENIVFTDNYDTTYTIVQVGDIDINTFGTYTVTYTVVDSSGNVSNELTRHIEIVDSKGPVITINGDEEISVEVFGTYTDLGATATDNYDLESTVVTVNNVNTDLVGTYDIVYTSTDAKGNETTLKRTVNVVDTDSPTLILNDTEEVTIGLGEIYIPDATTSDNYDEAPRVIVLGDIDYFTMGTYNVTVKAVDSSGNESTGISRTVHITVAFTTPSTEHIRTYDVNGITADIKDVELDSEGYLYLAAQIGNKAVVIKTDSYGEVIWTKEFGDDAGMTININDMTIDTDGNIVYVGHIWRHNTGHRNPFVERIDKDGNNLMSINTSLGEYGDFEKVFVDSQGNLIVTGKESHTPDGYQGYKYNSIIYKFDYPFTINTYVVYKEDSNITIEHFNEEQDGSYRFIGVGHNAIFEITTQANLSNISCTMIESYDTQHMEILENNEGNLILVNSKTDYPGSNFIKVLQVNGTIDQQIDLSGLGYIVRPFGIIENSLGYIIAGQAYTSENDYNKSNVILIQINNNFELVSYHIIGGNSTDWPEGINVLHNGYVVAFGTATSTDGDFSMSDSNSGFVIKFDDNYNNLLDGDKEAPHIILEGPSVIEIEKGSIYLEPGATVFDNVDESSTVHIYKDNVDVNTPGTYYVYYTAEDQAGNKALSRRTVIVSNALGDTNLIIDLKTVEVEEPRMYGILLSYDTDADGYLSKDEIKEITSLSITSGTITTLNTLKYLVHLESLNFYNMNISDITPLSELTKLTYLDLGYTNVSDLEALETLVNLEYLDLSVTGVSDITSLGYLTNLKTLKLQMNNITDITALGTLVNLETLYLYNNQITDVSVIGNLVKLKDLNFATNQVTDISSFFTLVELKELFVSQNSISDLSSLSSLTNLEVLRFADNNVVDICTVSNLTALYYLEFSDNPITSISCLDKLTKIKTFVGYNVDVDDVNVVANFTLLEEFGIQATTVTDITGFNNLDNIEWMVIRSIVVTPDIQSVIDTLESKGTDVAIIE